MDGVNLFAATTHYPTTQAVSVIKTSTIQCLGGNSGLRVVVLLAEVAFCVDLFISFLLFSFFVDSFVRTELSLLFVSFYSYIETTKDDDLFRSFILSKDWCANLALLASRLFHCISASSG